MRYEANVTAACTPRAPPVVYADALQPKPEPPPPNASQLVDPPACGYAAAGAPSYLLDATKWLSGGVVLGGDPALSHASLVGARAYPHNFDATVRAKLLPSWAAAGTAPTAAEIQISLAALPALDPNDAWTMRAADDRVGYWVMHFTELGSLSPEHLEARQTDKAVRVIQRWRLEKRDPACTSRCAPVRPIVYHIDPSVPPHWRATTKRAVEAWNAAFEQARPLA